MITTEVEITVPRSCFTSKSVINRLAMCRKCVASVMLIVVVIIRLKAGFTNVLYFFTENFATKTLVVRKAPYHHSGSEGSYIIFHGVS